MDLKGKTALVTGGAHRVGKAISLELAQAGANVVINYLVSNQAAETTAIVVEGFGVGALTVQADVADPDQVENMVRTARDRFGAVDILVNSASPFEKTPFPTQDLSAWRRVTGVLLDGAFFCANAVAPMMLERGEGAMVNIVDLSVFQPWPNFTAHSVGKAGLLALTRQLAVELAPDVRVNAIAPGNVLPPPHYDQAQITRAAGKSLLNRWGRPEDVAQAVLFLLNSDFITGEVIVVDGGERFGRYRSHKP